MAVVAFAASCGDSAANNAAGDSGADASDAAALDATKDTAADVASEQSARDAAGDTGAEAPSDGPQPACNPEMPFGAPVLLSGANLNTAFEEGGPSLTPDELTLYFSGRGRRDGNPQSPSDLLVTHRSGLTAPFDEPSLLTTLESSGNNFDPMTNTGLTIFFTSERTDSGLPGQGHLWMATRASTTVDFDPPTKLPPPLNTTPDDAGDHVTDREPFVTADGSELWFASDRQGDLDLYRAPAAGASFVAPERVAEISTVGAKDYTPVLSADRLVIFFASERPDDHPLDGTTDIWTASRAQVTDPFSSVHSLPVLNSPNNDFPTWISRDGCRLYLSSTRLVGDASLSENLYVATRGK
jgi:hypothetical protein